MIVAGDNKVQVQMPDCRARDIRALTEVYCEEEDEDEVQMVFFLVQCTSSRA